MSGEPRAAPPAAEPHLLPMLRRHGWNATSFQTLEPGLRHWFADLDACVAYADTGRAWVAAGAPLAAPERFDSVAAGFAQAARAAGRRACFFATERRFVERTSFAALQIGEQPTWDPRAWESTVSAVASLRAQLRRAGAKGVTVRAVPAAALDDPTAPLRAAARRVTARWLTTRGLPPMGFLVHPEALSRSAEARGFVAYHQGRLIGFALAVPILARGGWLIQHLVRDPQAPNGTAELLVDQVMRVAAGQGAGLVTLGLSPLSGELHAGLRLARRLGGRLFNFDGLRAFKAKLRPHAWDPIYLSYPAARGAGRFSGALAIYDVLAAFARGGFLRFGLETLRLGGARALRGLPGWTPAALTAEATRGEALGPPAASCRAPA